MKILGRADLGHFRGTSATTQDGSEFGFGGGSAPPFFFALGRAPRRAPTDAALRRDARACVLTSTPFFSRRCLKGAQKEKDQNQNRGGIWRSIRAAQITLGSAPAFRVQYTHQSTRNHAAFSPSTIRVSAGAAAASSARARARGRT